MQTQENRYIFIFTKSMLQNSELVNKRTLVCIEIVEPLKEQDAFLFCGSLVMRFEDDLSFKGNHYSRIQLVWYDCTLHLKIHGIYTTLYGTHLNMHRKKHVCQIHLLYYGCTLFVSLPENCTTFLRELVHPSAQARRNIFKLSGDIPYVVCGR